MEYSIQAMLIQGMITPFFIRLDRDAPWITETALFWGLWMLSRSCSHHLGPFRCKDGTMLLAFVWSTGLTCGAIFADSFDLYFASQIHHIVDDPVSMGSLLSSLFLPFLLSALATLQCRPLLFFISFFKAFSYGACFHGVTLAFPHCGWLIRCLLLFSDNCALPVLYIYWIRHVSRDPSCLRREFLYCFCYLLSIAVMDVYWVSPFLVRVMQ